MVVLLLLTLAVLRARNTVVVVHALGWDGSRVVNRAGLCALRPLREQSIMVDTVITLLQTTLTNPNRTSTDNLRGKDMHIVFLGKSGFVRPQNRCHLQQAVLCDGTVTLLKI